MFPSQKSSVFKPIWDNSNEAQFSHLLVAAADIFLDLFVHIYILSCAQPKVDSTRIYSYICIKVEDALWILEFSLLLLVQDTEA